MVNKAMLKDDEDKIIAIYESDKDTHEFSASGNIKYVISWTMEGEPIETEFFADVYVKWDGCSHFRFYGEDYLNGDKDSYYHICGAYTYLDFMRMMIFAYEIMVENVGFDKIDEKEELEVLRSFGLLKDCTIVFE